MGTTVAEGDSSEGPSNHITLVLKGSVEFSIFYSGEGDALEISKALAQKGLANL